jgi:hypothetical protein
MTDNGRWTTDDVCEKCRGFPSWDRVAALPMWGCKSIGDSTCVLCRFFKAMFGAREHSALNTTSATLNIRHHPVPLSVLDQIGSRIETAWVMLLFAGSYDFRRLRFMVPFSFVEGDGDWPTLSTKHKTDIITTHEETRLPYHRLQKDSVDIDFLKLCIESCKVFHVELCDEPDKSLLSSVFNSSGFRLVDCRAGVIIRT